MPHYKVLKVMADGTLRSSQVHNEKYGLVYPIGEWVEAVPQAKAKGYGPLVFETFNQAYQFNECYGLSTDAIYKCEVRGVMEHIPPLLRFISAHYFFFRDRGCSCFATIGLPQGTVMVESVKLLYSLYP